MAKQKTAKAKVACEGKARFEGVLGKAHAERAAQRARSSHHAKLTVYRCGFGGPPHWHVGGTRA